MTLEEKIKKRIKELDDEIDESIKHFEENQESYYYNMKIAEKKSGLRELEKLLRGE